MDARLIREKVGKLKQLATENGDIQMVFDIIILYYPILLDNPENATESIIKGYNRIIETNISSIDLRKLLLI